MSKTVREIDWAKRTDSTPYSVFLKTQQSEQIPPLTAFSLKRSDANPNRTVATAANAGRRSAVNRRSLVFSFQ